MEYSWSNCWIKKETTQHCSMKMLGLIHLYSKNEKRSAALHLFEIISWMLGLIQECVYYSCAQIYILQTTYFFKSLHQNSIACIYFKILDSWKELIISLFLHVCSVTIPHNRFYFLSRFLVLHVCEYTVEIVQLILLCHQSWKHISW